MKFLKRQIPDVILIEATKFKDNRGFFTEMYHQKKFSDEGISLKFVQDNYACSRKNTLRGLHYQYKFPQGKLVRCLNGEILDIAVDIRLSSSTYGDWVGEVLSSENMRQLYIPPGFAHGYLVLSDWAEVEYKCTELYHPEDNFGIIWNDPQIDIDWGVINPILSDKDKKNPFLKDIGEELFK